ncbi:16S rRNA (cytosine(1402)-N(4))-methyltransferase RsmH [Myxococcota bacterium]|nr:16S rRNA (cytosine(1402)-N(4))-methyltransferase RsmH [Myxococcota bacterium]MBU1897850.1 16S rRNA (cytosine(1402)-N(4))-methyltransferase RsmH [Myxococcota bacterium]
MSELKKEEAAIYASPLPPHTPVLLEQTRALASVEPGDVWLDCTLGAGGHAELLLEAGAVVYAIDRDPQARALAATRLAPFGARFTPLAGDFRQARALLDAVGVAEVDGLLADVGVSSMQLDEPARGFSFRAAGPVDMRMSSEGPTALDLIDALEERDLSRLLMRYGEEPPPRARLAARAIKAWRGGPPPHDTATLAAAIAEALPRSRAQNQRRTTHPATKAFQALRVAVNDELGALDALLAALPTLLRPGGRALLISFHSLEDRAVKQAFQGYSRPTPPPRRGLPPPSEAPPPFELLHRKPLVATEAEIEANPRARTAKLRGVRRRA